MSARVSVIWVYDVISPFAYLALARLAELPPNVELTMRPVLFAGLLDHFGQRGPAEIAPKRRFTYRFALWRARRLKLPMRFPPAHPFNPLAALRLIIAAGCDQRAARTVLDAVFRDGRDVSDLLRYSSSWPRSSAWRMRRQRSPVPPSRRSCARTRSGRRAAASSGCRPAGCRAGVLLGARCPRHGARLPERPAGVRGSADARRRLAAHRGGAHREAGRVRRPT